MADHRSPLHRATERRVRDARRMLMRSHGWRVNEDERIVAIVSLDLYRAIAVGANQARLAGLLVVVDTTLPDGSVRLRFEVEA